jgi:lipopolysaccharide export system permease protein
VNLLDRYIFKSVLGTCTAAVGMFAFVVALPNVIRDLMGPLLAGQIPFGTFVVLVALLFPFAISFALPMGVLTGVLLTLGRLAADSEITAMRASGISLTRMALPVLGFGTLGAAAALYVNFEAMPRARTHYHRTLADTLRANPLSFIVPKTFIREFQGTVLFVGEREGSVLRDIWLWELDAQKRVRRLLRAKSGRLEYDEATNSLMPTLVQAKVEERSAENPEDFSRSPLAPSFEKAERVPIPLGDNFAPEEVRRKPKHMTYAELRVELARLARETPAAVDEAASQASEHLQAKIVFHEKYNFALAVFSFALLGIPLGITVSRRETSANLGIALLLVLGYYILTMMIKWLDHLPELRPELLIWAPNLLFIALGIRLLRRIEQC